MYEEILILGILITIGAAVFVSNRHVSIINTHSDESKKVEGFANSFSGKRNLWFVIDDYGVNSRRWADFGARSSRDLNIGLLSITKTRCAVTQGGDFNIVELFGRAAVAHTVRENGGFVPDRHQEIPPYLWRAWARAALLANGGGLYLDGFSLCLGESFASVTKNHDNLAFGLDTEPLSAGSFAGWASKPRNLPWVNYLEVVTKFIERGPASWNAAQARNQVASWNANILAPAVKLLVEPEWSRLGNGNIIEIEDLFGTGLSELYNPGPKAIYVPVDAERLMRAVSFNWVLRLSSEQLMAPESQFIWAQLAQRVGKRDALTKKSKA
jgi:hypothetical protein